MKICILGDAASIHIRRMAQGLAGRKNIVRVVSHKVADIPGVTVERFTVPAAGWRYPARWHQRRSMFLRRLLREHDIVHVHFLNDWGLTPTSVAAGRLVVSPWGSDIVKPPDMDAYPEDLVRIRRDLLLMAQQIIVHGRDFAQTVAAFAGLPVERIMTVPLGIDLDLFQPRTPAYANRKENLCDSLPETSPAPIVGFFKGFKAVYGPTVWIQAMPRVLSRLPDARFELVGRGPLLETCQAMAQELGVAHATTWLDVHPHEEIPKRIGRWSLSVIPSFHESFCVAALESSAMEVPVVASRAGGLIETVRDGVTGLLVPPGDPEALADAVVKLLGDSSLRRKMGMEGRKLVMREYESSNCLDRLLDAYQSLCDGRGTQRSSLRYPRSDVRPSSSDLQPSTSNLQPPSVLMIAAAFPPTGGPGVQRTAKFAKYLPQFGWTPRIWTVNGPKGLNGLPRDLSLVADLPPDCIVHSANKTGSRALTRVIGRLHQHLRQRPFPDDCSSWALHSVKPLVQVIEQDRIDVMYSTFSPASNHLLALELKRRTGLPWVADFRDLWTDDYRYCETSAARRLAERRLEQEILEAADVVIGVTERQTAILADHVPTARDKFVTITNGFDPADFPSTWNGREPSSEPMGCEARLTLAHVGRFDRWRAVDAWYAGLRRFVEHIGPDRDRFVLHIVGHANETTRRRLCETGARCEFTGYVSHTEAVRRMRGASALLLSVPDGPNADTVIPAKLFEYLASGRPILVVGPEGGECERLAQGCHAGLSAPFDAGAIAHALEKLFQAWSSGCPVAGCHPTHLEPYSRIELTRALASILDQLVIGDVRDDTPVGLPVEVATG